MRRRIGLQQFPKVMLHGQDVSRHGETQKPDKECKFASMEIGSFFFK